MKLNTMPFSGRAVLALAMGAALTTSCSKEDAGYKKNSDNVTTTAPTTSSPETTTTTTVPTIGYLTLASSSPIVLNGRSNIIIENKRISMASAVAANLSGCTNITFRNCFFDGAGAEAIVLYNCKNITIEKCLFARATCGVYASSSQTIVVRNNQFVNMRQRINPDGTKARGQNVQFNNVTGAGNIVEDNRGENFAGESDPEDIISMYKSSGTSASPILIRNNKFRGGGPSKSGGGILAGDYGGDYIRIENNQLVNPGNYGIAIVGGKYNVLNNNRVYSDYHDYNNAGVIIWAQGGVTSSYATYTNNHINWPYKSGGQNNEYINGNITPLTKSGNVFNESLSVMIPDFPKELITFITSAELLSIRK